MVVPVSIFLGLVYLTLFYVIAIPLQISQLTHKKAVHALPFHKRCYVFVIPQRALSWQVRQVVRRKFHRSL